MRVVMSSVSSIAARSSSNVGNAGASATPVNYCIKQVRKSTNSSHRFSDFQAVSQPVTKVVLTDDILKETMLDLSSSSTDLSVQLFEIAFHVQQGLKKLLDEEKQFNVNLTSIKQSANPTLVTQEDRRRVIVDLQFINKVMFGDSTEILFKAINLLDRFVSKMKIEAKYFEFAGIACYMIAYSDFHKRPMDQADKMFLLRTFKYHREQASLERMKDSITKALYFQTNVSTVHNFLRVMMTDDDSRTNHTVVPERLLKYAVCVLADSEIAELFPSCLALALVTLCARHVSVSAETDAALDLYFVSPMKLQHIADQCQFSEAQIQLVCRDIQDAYARSIGRRNIKIVPNLARKPIKKPYINEDHGLLYAIDEIDDDPAIEVARSGVADYTAVDDDDAYSVDSAFSSASNSPPGVLSPLNDGRIHISP